MNTVNNEPSEGSEDQSLEAQPQRAVDRAMSERRAEKATIRSIWVEQVRFYRERYPFDNVPVYLTLSGAEGKDIRLLVDRGLIETTEVGSITKTSQPLVIAVERSLPAVLALQRQFPGLRILEQDFENIVHGNNPARFPSGRDQERICRARVINLDLQESLNVQETDGNSSFPVITWIEKLCTLHALPPVMNWSLCLTLNGNLRLTKRATSEMQSFLTENFNRVQEFGDASRILLGDDTFTSIIGSTAIEFSTLPTDIQQKLLMLFVPKKIAHLVHSRGWLVRTTHNLYYGGKSGHAPMVTWVMDFTFDSRSNPNRAIMYRESLVEVLQAAGYISEAGEIEIVQTVN